MGSPRIVAGDGGPERDEFVQSHARGTPFHLAGWGRAVEGGFGQHAEDLLAYRGQALTGVLPLVRMRSVLFGDRLVSTPFGSYGGPLAADPGSAEALLDAAVRRANRMGLRHVELRCREEGPASWAGRTLYSTFRGPLAGSADAFLAARPKETRRQIRIGLEAGLVPCAGADLFREFYALFARGYRDHGTPVFPRRWFAALEEHLPGRSVVFGLRDGARGRLVAAVWCLLFRDEVQPYYVGADRDAYARKVNHALYFELARYARDRGARLFDFGRSKKGTGSFDFKRRFGFAEADLDYRYHLVRDERVPDLNPLNANYRFGIALWRRLPVSLATGLGPLVVRGIG